jgi:hypothetical protein
MKLFRVRCLVLLVATTVSLALEIRPARAEVYQDVQCLVAYDEEFDSVARDIYRYSPQVLCRILLDEVSHRFRENFKIRFLVAGYATWDSNDTYWLSQSPVEAVEEVGFYRGKSVNGYEVEVLIALTDQCVEGDGAYGWCWTSNHAIIVRETLLGLPGLRIQSTDNVIQHELSHFYDCVDHYIAYPSNPHFDCVMNCFRYDFVFPEGYVPHALVTENWCVECEESIRLNEGWFGYPQQIGGGSPGEFPLPYSVNGTVTEL